MTTKAPADVNYTDSEVLIKKIYTAIDELKDYVPTDNERNRISFCINLYFEKQIDTIYDALCQAKPKSSTVDFKELEQIVIKKFKEKGINR